MSRSNRRAVVEEAPLDAADRRLLRAIQANGRMSNQDLAQLCDLSNSSCSKRLSRLREQGYITGFTALIDPARVGRSLLIFIEVALERPTSENFEALAATVRRSAEVLECHKVIGAFDYLIKARVKDMAAYGTFLINVLAAVPGLRSTRSYVAIEEIKNTTALPL
jgi:Lrp/AsnC family leucine-responsive transcriptional regulator